MVAIDYKGCKGLQGLQGTARVAWGCEGNKLTVMAVDIVFASDVVYEPKIRHGLEQVLLGSTYLAQFGAIGINIFSKMLPNIYKNKYNCVIF